MLLTDNFGLKQIGRRDKGIDRRIKSLDSQNRAAIGGGVEDRVGAGKLRIGRVVAQDPGRLHSANYVASVLLLLGQHVAHGIRLMPMNQIKDIQPRTKRLFTQTTNQLLDQNDASDALDAEQTDAAAFRI